MEVSEVVLIAWLDCHITSNIRTAVAGLFPLVLLANGLSSGAPGADRCVAAYDQTTGNCDLVCSMCLIPRLYWLHQGSGFTAIGKMRTRSVSTRLAQVKIVAQLYLSTMFRQLNAVV